MRQFAWWFRGGADSAIAERFPLLLERATRGELEHWSHRPAPRLALIIILDQFSRSLYRGTAQAFAQDQKALALALEGIEIDHYADLETPWEKTFFFLPLGHSEELKHLEVAVKLAEELVEQAPAELRRVLGKRLANPICFGDGFVDRLSFGQLRGGRRCRRITQRIFRTRAA
ncbi:MAG: DUF924 family protein, partial [Gammaproteobacteria bacterium]